MKTINSEDIKIKAKKLEWRAKGELNKFKDWCRNNPEQAAVVLSGAIGVAGYVGKATIKNINLRKQEAVKVLYCYDRSLGHYWHLRRELTNKEWLEIDRRKKAGERLADILSEMRVLK